MSAGEPRDDSPVICDTVVVHYFVAVGRFELLAGVLGGAVHVPTAVFDPDEDTDLADEALSELRRGLKFHQRQSADTKIPDQRRKRSVAALPHFRKLDDHAADGSLHAVPLTGAELSQFAQLRTLEHVRQFGLKAPLGRGEAAMLAIAASRGWGYATDDNDAVTVGRVLIPDIRPRRTRSLLLECVNRDLCSRDEVDQLPPEAGIAW